MTRLRHVDACDASVAGEMVTFKAIPAPVDCTDADAFPEIARAIAGLAAMSPERRAMLDAEWDA